MQPAKRASIDLVPVEGHGTCWSYKSTVQLNHKLCLLLQFFAESEWTKYALETYWKQEDELHMDNTLYGVWLDAKFIAKEPWY